MWKMDVEIMHAEADDGVADVLLSLVCQSHCVSCTSLRKLLYLGRSRRLYVGNGGI